jgi:geranylgeranyl diphosphate synthase type I
MEDSIKNKQKIQSILNQTYERFGEEFSHINTWSKDLTQRFRDFSLGGKMARSNLVLLAASLFGQPPTEDSYKVAASVEILHASLLIHDDIMDNDTQRRGKESMFFQYQKLAQQKQAEEWRNIGKSLAICAGDIGFFLAYKLINSTELSAEKRTRLFSEINKELIIVGLGQMQDVANSLEFEVSENNILNLYKYKTGRYTFSLPFSLGAILANQSPESIVELQKIGEQIGIIFQLKDDEIGTFGTTEQIGKPVGSDIREGKKTLYYYYLHKFCSSNEKQELNHLFGNSNINDQQINHIKKLIEKYKIQKKIDQKTAEIKEEVYIAINKLPITEENKKSLIELTASNVTRKK